MRRVFLPFAVFLLIGFCAAAAQEAPVQPPGAEGIFRPWPLHKSAEMVTSRYAGRIIAAQIEPPKPHERRSGVELVYEFRLITPRQNLLRVRINARDGAFLETSGRGQIEARRRAVDGAAKGATQHSD